MTETLPGSAAPLARERLFSRLSDFFRSPAVKLVGLMVIGLMLMIPLALVWALAYERDHRSGSVIREIGQQWGAPQHLSGPYLVLPYKIELVGTKKVEVVGGTADNPIVLHREEPDIHEEVRYAVFAPQLLKVDGDIETEVRKRSIYEATIYTADLDISGRFDPIEAIDTRETVVGIEWEKMQLVVGIAGLSGIESAELRINSGEAVRLEPGTGNLSEFGMAAVHSPAVIRTAEEMAGGLAFRLDLRLRGSERFHVAPAGGVTDVDIRSSWPHPSFIGRFLPGEREISDKGFSASWSVPHLARPLPSQWHMGDKRLGDLSAYEFGVRFVTPVDFYSLVDRALKYGLMFIGIVFAIVFAMEMSTGARVHGVQYLLVGLMIIMFFLLLLAFAEHIGFPRAYLVAALATGTVLTAYVATVFGGLKRALAAAASFVVLYGVLYLILQLEDYALLAGACLGFLMLTAVLFGTRRLDWSAVRSAAVRSGQEPVAAG